MDCPGHGPTLVGTRWYVWAAEKKGMGPKIKNKNRKANASKPYQIRFELCWGDLCFAKGRKRMKLRRLLVWANPLPRRRGSTFFNARGRKRPTSWWGGGTPFPLSETLGLNKTLAREKGAKRAVAGRRWLACLQGVPTTLTDPFL